MRSSSERGWVAGVVSGAAEADGCVSIGFGSRSRAARGRDCLVWGPESSTRPGPAPAAERPELDGAGDAALASGRGPGGRLSRSTGDQDPRDRQHHQDEVAEVEQRRRPGARARRAGPGATSARTRRRPRGTRSRPRRTRATSRRSTCHASPASTSATTVGIADWNTIAPVMLPIARVSLPWRTQISELNFSGSSVAIGAITSASSSSLTPSGRRDPVHGAHEQVRAADDARRGQPATWRSTIRSRGATRSRRRPGSRRRKRSGARSSPPSSASASRCPFTYHAYIAEQRDRHDDPRPAQLRRQERRADRERVGDHEVADVVDQDHGVEDHAGPRRASRRKARTPMPVTNMASVESMNGAPRMAPTPTSLVEAPPSPKPIAMIGIIVSGRAVPTAARTEPTAPWASSSLRPNHSMPLVNSSAPTRMTTNAIARTTRSISPPG